MKDSLPRRPAFAIVLCIVSETIAAAQDRVPADPDTTPFSNAAEGGESGRDWQFGLGVGTIYGPAFLGSDDYQLAAGPIFEVRYRDRFFLSVSDGAGVDLIKTESFQAGPVVKFQQERKESGDTAFRIAGAKSDALRGLGDVPATAEAGGYLRYQLGALFATAEVRKGIGGHDGLIAELGVRYTTPLAGLSLEDRPVTLSIGLRATIVDDTYNQAYFGVRPEQSVRSGLARYNAGGGLLSYGVGGALFVPVSSSLSVAMLAGFDRLADDAAKSPLVIDRGSRDQATVGLSLIHRFGL